MEEFLLKMKNLSNEYSLINKYTNLEKLEKDTKRLIEQYDDIFRNKCTSNELNDYLNEIVIILTDMWYPSIVSHMKKSGGQWSSYWEIDMIIMKFLENYCESL
jgi:hypothetical protein